MKTQTLLFTVLLLTGYSITAQTTISGTVTDNNQLPVEGANVYLKGTFDGTTTNADGIFSFETEAEGTQTLIVSFLAFESFEKKSLVSEMKNLKIKLRENVNTIDAVVISAGTFKAGDNSKANTLKPLDVVTTAGAAGDFIGALQTLPGTTSNPDDGRLFVRGGRAEETQIFIDDARVFHPFTPTTGNIPTRGRFSPFLFDGITFSTGGYSAEYGGALSSVLLLNTTDFPQEEKTDISIMTVGGGIGNTQIWGDNSLSVNTSYLNLAPYFELQPQNNDFINTPEALSGEAVYRHKTKNGLLKLYTAYSYSDFTLNQPDINSEDGFNFGLANRNLYGNINYTEKLGTWKLELNTSYAHDHTDIDIAETRIENLDNSAHFKVKAKTRLGNRTKLTIGAEQFLFDYNETANLEGDDFKTPLNYGNTGTFAELELRFSKKLAALPGIRADYFGVNDHVKISPRLAFAYKLSDASQLSLAYGGFNQLPQQQVLAYNNSLDAETAQHYIANYMYQKDGQMLRVEGFYKSYNQLLKYDTEMVQFDSNFSNAGDGYATGIDIFWRDEKSIKNLEYWISYSYLDTERDFQDFPTEATPNFATKHNLSVVSKYWIDDIKSQLGFSYNYASGRPFNNPNSNQFQDGLTKPYGSLSFNWAYLISQQKILYFSISNVLGQDNVFGYQYADTLNLQGNFNRRAIGQAADRFVFVGFFWTIGGNDNQLDNL